MTWTSGVSAIAFLVVAVPSQSRRVPAPPLPAAPDKNLSYLGQPVAASDVTFTIERTMCFGECPCYVIQIHGDGGVEWQGKNYVVRKIRLHSRIEPQAVQLLLDRAGEMDFFQHPVSLDMTGMDGPNCKLTIHIAGMEQKADVPWSFTTKNWKGEPDPDWKTMRDEVDFTLAMDALSESWRWIHTREDAPSEERTTSTSIPDGFSIGVRRRTDHSPQYTLTIDGAGAGTWLGSAHVRERGDRTFTVPRVEMSLLVGRAQRLVGFGKNIGIDGPGEDETDLYVHASGLDPGLRVHVAPLREPNSSVESAEYVKAAALADLVDVFARTSHFAGSWDEQQAAAPEPTSSPK